MRKGRMILMPAVFFLCSLLFLVSCEKGVNTDLTAAEEAIAAAKAEGAPDYCPEQYASAELKLKQAQLLFEDNEDEAGKEAASDAVTLGQEAMDCAIAAKQPDDEGAGSFSDAMAAFKHSVYFNFNDNALSPEESKKLFEAAVKLKKWQNDHKFWILIETHADLPGNPEENYEVTAWRARVVRFFLIQKGLDPDRIIMRARGEALANKELVKSGKTAKKDINKKNQMFRRADVTILEEMPTEKPSDSVYWY